MKLLRWFKQEFLCVHCWHCTEEPKVVVFNCIPHSESRSWCCKCGRKHSYRSGWV